MIENNENQTINLGNNVGGATPPVFGNTQVVPPTQTPFTVGGTQAVQSPVIPTQSSVTTTVTATNTEATVIQMPQQGVSVTQNMHSEVVDVEPEQITIANQPILIDGEVTLPTVVLKELINIARKVGVANNTQPRSEVLNILFNENGIILRATSGNEDIEIIDKRYIFKNPVEMSLDIKMVGSFINSVSTNNVTLSYDNVNNILTIVTDGDNGSGTFKFPQKIDLSTQQPIVNELTFSMAYADMHPVNYEDFLQTLSVSKTVRNFANKLGMVALEGTYFSDIIASSDRVLMLMQENKLGLGDKEFFLKSKFCDLVATLPFDLTKFRIGFISNPATNVVGGIICSDERITLCGSADVPIDFPIDLCRNYWKSEGFANTVKVDRKVLVDTLNPVIQFINPLRDRDKIAISIVGNVMKIGSMSGEAEYTIMVENVNNISIATPIYLPATKLYSTLQTISDKTIDLLIDTSENSPCICLAFSEYKCLVAYVYD